MLTAALVLSLATFATLLPAEAGYVPGVDDGPIERFKTIGEAENAAGFDFPDAGSPSGWKLEDATVIPAYYVMRLMAENPKLASSPLPNQGDTPSARLWRSVPGPPPGVHNYVSISYTSNIGAVISLNINMPISNGSPLRPMSEAQRTDDRRVRIGDSYAKLVTYELFGQDLEAMVVEWRIGRVPVRATAFNLSPNTQYRITQDEFVAFLANVR